MTTNISRLTKKSSGAALLLVAFSCLRAQQTSLFNTYNLDPMQINIAYSKENYSQATLLYRAQWIGMKETPKTLQLNAFSDIGMNSAVKLRVQSLTQGIYNLSGFTLGYSYSFLVKKDARIHAGLGAGLTRASVKSDKAIVLDAEDPALRTGGQLTANSFDSEAGVMYIDPKLKAGFSVLHLYNTDPDFSGSSGYRSLPQLNTQVAYVFRKGKDVELEPCVLVRNTIKGNNTVEGIFNVNFLKKFTAGLGYRQSYGLLALAGAEFGNIMVAYSFDYGFDKNSRSLGTSHQLMLRFAAEKQKTSRKISTQKF